MSSAMGSVFSLFIIMFVGVYGSKKKIITPEINRGLTNILLDIALPFTIVSSFILQYNDDIRSNVTKMFYYSFITYIVMIGLSLVLLLPMKGDKKPIVHFSNIFTNTSYIGFPVLHSIYGAEGVMYGSIFNISFTVFIWTYGILIFRGDFNKEKLKEEIIKVFLNPSIIAVFIGILMMILDIQLPEVLLSSIKGISNMTAPLSMIIIGAILSRTKIQDYFKEKALYYGVLTRLIMIPLLIFLISLWMGERSKVMHTVIIMSAMPTAAMTSMFAESFNKQKEFAAVLVATTTLLSMVTLPILLKIIIK